MQYSGIGSNLMTFIKLFVVNVLNKETIDLQSIRNNRTRNFYTGQFFNQDSDTSDHFHWRYNPKNLEENLWYKNFHIPFEVTKNSKLKYDSKEEEEPDRKSPRRVFKPYERAIFVHDVKTIGGTKKKKRCIKMYKEKQLKRRTSKKKNLKKSK